MKTDLTSFSDRELSLQAFNNERLYKMMEKSLIAFYITIQDEFSFTDKQFEILIDDVEARIKEIGAPDPLLQFILPKKANNRLMAAAPEMYDALCKIMETAIEKRGMIGEKEMLLITSALEKAEGKS